MKPTVYLETTVVGYLAMRVSGILRVAANQQTTRDWWDNHRWRSRSRAFAAASPENDAQVMTRRLRGHCWTSQQWHAVK